MWGYWVAERASQPASPYELVWLCSSCAKARRRQKPMRAEETLLPPEYKRCSECAEFEMCDACRDYGKA